MESAATKPYFRNAWKTGRCIIPADGWFEWKASERGKQPYFIHRADDQPVLMAGLYEINPHADVTTFAILTMEAKGALREVHDREPIVLSTEMGREWIKPDLEPDEVNAVIQSTMVAESFTWHAVSRKVNSSRHDGEELILRAEQE